MSMLDHSADDAKLDGLVLLDLPDHDSTEVSHHLEMDRLVKYADLLVWVLDPQKYADAAIHDRYIRPMASYSDVTMVVLNQIDRIPFEDRERALTDVKRILAEEGLPDVMVVGASATRGDGVEELKRELAARIRAKTSAKQRLSSDIEAAADVVVKVGGSSAIPGISPVDRQALDDALLDCAGVPQVVDAIAGSTRRRSALLTGWPVTRWLRRLRKDPLADLELDSELSMSALVGASAPVPSHVQRANAELAIRDLADKASVGLERPWRDAIRDASNPSGDDIIDALDDAIDRTSLGITKPALWWRLVQVVQIVAVIAMALGVAWLIVQGVAHLASADVPDLGSVAGLPVAAVVAIGALVLGIVLDIVSRVVSRRSGRRKARRADQKLRAAIDSVAEQRVIAPVQAELDAYTAYRSGILAALR